MFNRERILPGGSPAAILVLLVVAAAAVAIGPLMNLSSFDSRYFVALLLAMAATVIVVTPTDRVMRFGFVLLIISFGFGWRTFHVTSGLSVHPSEVLVWLLFAALLVRGLARRNSPRMKIPFLVVAFLVLVIMGVVPAYLRRKGVEYIIAESKVYLSIIPAFYVVQWMISDRKEWKLATRWCILIGAYIGLLGLIDYLAPNLSLTLSGNQSLETPIYGAEDTFQRVGFLFYGSYLGAFVIFMFFGFGIDWFIECWEAHDRRMMVVSGLAIIIMAAGMYLSGFRGLWYAVLGFSMLLALLFRRARVLIALMLVALPLLPATFFLRFESVFNQQYADSSFFNRLNRASIAIDQIQNFPLSGAGFGGTGYVHSDLLQIAATLGLPALLVFLLLLGGSIVRLFTFVPLPGPLGRTAAILFALLCAQLVIFTGEGLIVWPQMMIPFWFVWAMAYRFMELAKEEAVQPGRAGAQDLLPSTNLVSASSTQ